MSKTIRTHIEPTRYKGVSPREARKAEGRFSEALRKQKSGYVKHKGTDWRTMQ